jgi:hypothetical protein
MAARPPRIAPSTNVPAAAATSSRRNSMSVKLRFHTKGECAMPFSPFRATDPEVLIGRAMGIAWLCAAADYGHQVDLPDRVLLLEIERPTLGSWTVLGRFLFADLLGGFTIERCGRLFQTAAIMLNEVKHAPPAGGA